MDAPVSTHSRPKAAASWRRNRGFPAACFNTQPPEGGCAGGAIVLCYRDEFQHTAARRRLRISPCSGTAHNRFNTQPPEGGCASPCCRAAPFGWFQHTAARRRLRAIGRRIGRAQMFQHTAARRRLLAVVRLGAKRDIVSTHSRPKAAATSKVFFVLGGLGFNTQPPEGGCPRSKSSTFPLSVSTHSRPKAAAPCLKTHEKSNRYYLLFANLFQWQRVWSV